MSNELIRQTQYMPAMSIYDAVERRRIMVEFVQQCMTPEVDYGVIPGTKEKSLLKAGAEKLCTLFGLSVQFAIVQQTEDWTGEKSGGEPLFNYVYRCSVYRGDSLVAQGDGSCNSREKKFRYRNAQRVCPHCKQEAIIKGKAEYGGGFICFKNKGGCGAKFADNDKTITEQVVGQVFNPDVYDLVNTLQKMAQKRSLTAAVLIAVNASELFSQDLETVPAYEGKVRIQEEGEEVQHQQQRELTEEEVVAAIRNRMAKWGEHKLSTKTFITILCGFEIGARINLGHYRWALEQEESVWEATVQKMLQESASNANSTENAPQKQEKASTKKDKPDLKVVDTTIEDIPPQPQNEELHDPFADENEPGVLRDASGNIIPS